MNRKVLICVWVFAVLTSASSNAYACGLPPIASLYLSNKPCDPVTHRYFAQVGESITLDGSDSNDPDGGDPNLACTHYIKKFYFNFGDGSNYYETLTHYPDGGFDGGTWHIYSAPILCSPTVTVTDNDAGNDPAERRPPDKSASRSCSLAVVKVNLNMEGVPDDNNEVNPGGYVPVNDDDDNDNGIADRDEAPVNGEDDLVAISLSILPANLNRGEVELKVPGEDTPLRVWKYPDKRELIIPSNDPRHPSYCERWAPSELPPTLYVEGTSATLPRGTRLILSYIIDQLGCIHGDLVYITVYNTCTCPPSLLSPEPWETFPSSVLEGLEQSCGAILLPYCWCNSNACYTDDCGNQLCIKCCQNDHTGGVGGCAYHYLYNDICVGKCIWSSAENSWMVKMAEIGDTGKRIFYRTNHATADWYDDEGCLSPWTCSRITEYDCINNQVVFCGFRRFQSRPPEYKEDPEPTCPGHQGRPPGPPLGENGSPCP